MTATISTREALEAHTFNKGLGQCRCGLEFDGKGHRMSAWRQHMAEVLDERATLA